MHDVQLETSRWSWPARQLARDGAVVLATAGYTAILPLFLPHGTAGLNPLAGTVGLVVVALLLRASDRPGARVAIASLAATGLAAWAVLGDGQLATVDDTTNLLMPLAPVFPWYASALYFENRQRAWIVAALIAVAVTHPWSSSVSGAATGLLYVCTPMMFGFYLAARAQLVATLTDRAESAERERDLRTDRARSDERVRLAAELHDLVTHRISLMVLHAGALRITATDDATRDAAERVRATGCGALEELRDLIGLLRGRRADPEGSPRPAESGSDPDPDQDSESRAGRRPAHRIDGSDVRVASAAIGWTLLLTITVLSAQAALGQVNWVFPWRELALQLPGAAALLVRRRYPELVVVVTIVESLILLWLALGGPQPDPTTSGVIVLLVPATTPMATYAVGAYSRRPVLGATLVAGLTLLAARPWTPHVAVATVAAVFVGAPALLGLYVAARRRLITALTTRAERAKREQQLLADRARAEERARLAQEMHDIVTTRMHDMLDQVHALGETAATGAVEELVASGETALDELHSLVETLRTAGSSASAVEDTTGAGDLAKLAEESTAIGVPVELIQEGDPATASPAVDRTARRIVGESLTNVRKHALGARVLVRIQYSPNGVHVHVRNDKPPAAGRRGDAELAAGGSGTGLLGLRQRVELMDGTLTAGPTADGGFVVDAILPAYVPTWTSAVEGPN